MPASRLRGIGKANLLLIKPRPANRTRLRFVPAGEAAGGEVGGR